MRATSDDYSVDSSSDEELPAQDDDELGEEEVTEVGVRRSTRKTSKSQQATRAVFPTNLHAISLMRKHLSKRLKGDDIDRNLSIRILVAALDVQKGYLDELSKASNKKEACQTGTDS